MIAGFVADELRHAADDLAGVRMSISTQACYMTQGRAFGVMIAWGGFARGHYGQTTGPMVAELWALGARWKYIGGIFGQDVAARLIADEILADYGESSGGRPQP